MTYRALTLLTVTLALAVSALFALLPASARSPTLVPLSIAISGAVALASVLTARRIGWRDRLGLAWIAFGLCHIMLCATTALVGDSTRTAMFSLSPVVEWVRNALTFGANLFGIIAFVLFARVWSGTGLVPRWRWLATLVSVAVTLVVVGPTTWNDLHFEELAVKGVLELPLQVGLGLGRVGDGVDPARRSGRGPCAGPRRSRSRRAGSPSSARRGSCATGRTGTCGARRTA